MWYKYSPIFKHERSGGLQLIGRLSNTYLDDTVHVGDEAVNADLQ